MSSIDTDRFRDTLLDERRRVMDAISFLHEENPGSIVDETDESPIDNHMAETASVTFDRELDYTLEQSSEAVLRAIDEALERIDAGTFGVCRRCGEPISEERLEAIPYATLCIDCKRKESRG